MNNNLLRSYVNVKDETDIVVLLETGVMIGNKEKNPKMVCFRPLIKLGNSYIRYFDTVENFNKNFKLRDIK